MFSIGVSLVKRHSMVKQHHTPNELQIVKKLQLIKVNNNGKLRVVDQITTKKT